MPQGSDGSATRPQSSPLMKLPTRPAAKPVGTQGATKSMTSMNGRLRLCAYQTMATHDSLTGLPNRLGLNRYATKALRGASETKQVLSLAVIDCNGFKQLNDALGHEYGDLVLKLLARSLRRTVGRTAFPSRTGGDEFAVLFPATDREEASMFMERASELFSQVTRELGEGTSFAYGIAEYDGHSNLQQLIADADARMYARKRSGRAVVQLSIGKFEGASPRRLES